MWVDSEIEELLADQQEHEGEDDDEDMDVAEDNEDTAEECFCGECPVCSGESDAWAG